MNLIEKTFYENNIGGSEDSDFLLCRVNDVILVGIDCNNNISVLLDSMEENRDPLSQRTKMLSVECNKKVKYCENNTTKEGVFHILKCYAKKESDRRVFLKLCDVFFVEQETRMDNMIDIFGTLENFFGKQNKPSEIELRGLYGELFLMYFFHNKFDLCGCWQKQDKMKYDFSINSKTKLEVKSTIKPNRIHHFKHEQLASNILDIYVASIKLRKDNDGLSMDSLINNCIDSLSDYPKKVARLQKLLYMYTDDDTLKELSFDEEYTKNNIVFYNAKDIPKFNGDTPENVSDAEYDSNCEGVKEIPIDDMISILKESINS